MLMSLYCKYAPSWWRSTFFYVINSLSIGPRAIDHIRSLWGLRLVEFQVLFWPEDKVVADGVITEPKICVRRAAFSSFSSWKTNRKKKRENLRLLLRPFFLCRTPRVCVNPVRGCHWIGKNSSLAAFVLFFRSARPSLSFDQLRE